MGLLTSLAPGAGHTIEVELWQVRAHGGGWRKERLVEEEVGVRWWL